MKKLMLGIVFAGALALAGCGTKSCKDFCSKPCSGTTADCNAGCDKAAGLNTASGCGSKYDAMLSCASGLSDADRCSNTTTCQSQATSYVACVTDYCTAHPSDPECM